MTVTVATLRGMDPHAFADTAGDLRKAANKLHAECETYQASVEHPLAAKHGWHGGGQPDAEVVATVNALAFGTSSMRLRASGNVLAGLGQAMTTVRQRLTDAERDAEHAGLHLGDDGVVREPATSAVPTGPRGGRAVTPVSGDVDRLQRKVDGIVLFATAADALAKKRLAAYTKPLITTQTADRGLLQQARDDNGTAAVDLLGSIDVEKRLSQAEPRPLPPGHTLDTIRQYFLAYAPAALDALAMFAGTWLEAEGLVDLAVGTTGGILSAPETAGLGALAGAGIDLVGLGAVYVGQGVAGWGDQRLAGDLATARAETKGTESYGSARQTGIDTRSSVHDGVGRAPKPGEPWTGTGKTTQELIDAGKAPGKSGVPRSAQVLSKHARYQRGSGDKFPPLSGGPKQKLETAQQQLSEILTNPQTREVPIGEGSDFEGGYYYIAPDGRGAAYDAGGNLQYFGEFTYPG